jgi:glutamate-1-semialdehyde 2,1-aminomutase
VPQPADAAAGMVDPAAILSRARRVIPAGVLARARAAFADVIVRTQGAYLWSDTGKRYIDHLNAYGPIVIGHADPRVDAAAAAMARQVDLTAVGPQVGEVDLAERIEGAMPSAETVAFTSTGADAVREAVEIARVATGRARVLTFHGHDRGSAGLIGHESLTAVDWNDLSAAQAAFASSDQEYAAILIEPYLHGYTNVAPAPGFLEQLRILASRHRTILVFDEVKTGFRDHVGGYQAIAGVTPDLTAFGGALGNGYPIAGLAGRVELMDRVSGTSAVVGLCGANPYALAAGIATFDILASGGIEQLWAIGDRLRHGLERAIRNSGVRANVTGVGSGWIVNWRSVPPVTVRDAADADLDRANAFRIEMLAAGVLLPPSVLADARINLAFSDADVDETVEAAQRAFRKVK